MAADVATCTLSADKKTVTVTASNPYSQVMACEVNCHMAIPNGIATVVCVKPVPVGATDFVMCTEPAGEGRSYTTVKGSEINCPDPTAAAAPPAKDKETTDSDGDGDEDSDALVKKLQKQSVDMLKQLQKK